MNVLIKIAWRNIWRHPGRSSVLLAAIVAGIWAGVMVSAISNGFVQQRFERLVDEVSHIQMHHPEYRTERQVSMTIPEAEELVGYLEGPAQVEAFSARVLTEAMIQSPLTTSGVQIRGVDPESETVLTGISEQVIEGNYFTDDVRNPVLIGQSLAEKLNAQVGSRVVLTFQDLNNELVSVAYHVTGLYDTPSGLEERLVYVRLPELREQLATGSAIHEIALLAGSEEQVDSLAAALNRQFPEVETLTWYELSPELRLYADIGNQMTYYLMLIILIALAFGIVNTMLMAIFERIQELGMLMSVGMNRVRIFSMIILESFFITMTGTLIGMAFSILCIRYLYLNGLDLSMFGEGLAEFGYAAVVYPSLTPETFIGITLMVALVSILASVYPAVKAIRLQPAVAVRE